jgi:hypothetical protein
MTGTSPSTEREVLFSSGEVLSGSISFMACVKQIYEN